MGFEIDINLKWFCEFFFEGGWGGGGDIKTEKNYDHYWQQNKTMPLHDDAIIKLVLVIKSRIKFSQHQSAIYR